MFDADDRLARHWTSVDVLRTTACCFGDSGDMMLNMHTEGVFQLPYETNSSGTKRTPKVAVAQDKEHSGCRAHRGIGTVHTTGTVAGPRSVSNGAGRKRHRQACEQDSSNQREDWWLPQPHPSLDEEHIEYRPAQPLAMALRCSICADLLKEAMTTPECGHSYCFDCFDSSIEINGRRSNVCPLVDCCTILGQNPYENQKVKYDFILDGLVRKIFPRPDLDRALEIRRFEREEGTREYKASLSRRNVASLKRSCSQSGFGPANKETWEATLHLDKADHVVSVEAEDAATGAPRAKLLIPTALEDTPSDM